MIYIKLKQTHRKGCWFQRRPGLQPNLERYPQDARKTLIKQKHQPH